MNIWTYILILGISFAPLVGRAENSFKRNVDIEWETIQGAKTYDLELRKSDAAIDDKPLSFKSESNIWSGPLRPGNYKMRIRARDRRGVPGTWSGLEEFIVGLDPVQLIYPTNQAHIETKENELVSIELKWTKVGGAEKYSFDLISDDGKTKINEILNDGSLKLKLPVCAGYTWKVKAMGMGLESASTAADHFTLLGKKLQTPKIQHPDNAFVREVKWSTPDYTEQFAYNLTRFNPKTKTWEKIDMNLESKNSGITFSPLWRGGKYKLALKSKANLRPSSDKTEVEFSVREGDRSPAAEEVATVRQSIERLSGWYGIASYLITIMDFKGKNYDANSAASFNGIGGTGRLGAGFLAASNPWGFVGIVDMSGITLEGYGNYTFASSELNAIYRTHTGERGEIRQQAGLFYKELPELISTRTGTLREVNLLKYGGPHYGIEYWYAMTSRLGLQANAHLYPALFKVKTPNSQDIQPSMSAQFGLMGSYRLKKNMTGLLGYAFRHDEADYKSSPTAALPGNTNSAILEGHYLNLFLEWAL